VEEDRSFFPLTERLRLVKEGTRELGDKIAVIPSGKFIISMNTSEDYFAKDSITTEIDPSRDVVVFSGIIAPSLGICRRFVSEEPFCNVTRQYNESMFKILPKLGVEVVAVGRKESDGLAISASRVRKYLQKDNYEAIRRIVPQATY